MATHFFWDPVEDNVVQERDDAGIITAEYATEPYLYGNLISQNRGGIESQYHFDPQGSTLALTNDNQQVTDSYAYSAFGEVTEHTGSTVTPFQYLGQLGYYKDDVTESFLVRRRTLSASYGIWLSRDPILTFGLDTYYRYVRNTPCMRVDPSGLKCSAKGQMAFLIRPGNIPIETDTAYLEGDKCYSGEDLTWDDCNCIHFNERLPKGKKPAGNYSVTVVFSSYHDTPRECNKGLEDETKGWPSHDPTNRNVDKNKINRWKVWLGRTGSLKDQCTIGKAKFGKDDHGCLTVTFVLKCPVKCISNTDGGEPHESECVCDPTKQTGYLIIGTTRGGGGETVRTDWTIGYGNNPFFFCQPCNHAEVTMSQGKDYSSPPYMLDTEPRTPPTSPSGGTRTGPIFVP